MNVVVTGGATSLGLIISRRFHLAGATVFALDIDEKAVAALARIPRLEGMVLDVLNPSHVENAFAEIVACSGPIDTLVNNVGLPGPRAPIETISIADWNRTIEGSLGAAFYCTRCVVPLMKQRGSGSIINISTTSVKTGLPNRTPYVVAKAALEAFTTNCARELGRFNIRVNTVRPGPLDNERLGRIIQTHADEKKIPRDAAEAQLLRYFSMGSKIPLNEVAELVHFLASPEAPHITGQCIAVDGNAEWEE